MIDFKVHLPINFLPEKYPIKNKRFGNRNHYSSILLQSLVDSSEYHCMYCGKTVHFGSSNGINGTFEKEHSIEKKQANIEYKYLTHCKFNIGISCNKCNSLKKNKIEFLPLSLLGKIDIQSCLKKECTGICDEYLKLYKKYCHDNFMILNPLGFTLKRKPLQVEYDLINRKYQPSETQEYSLEEKDFIKKYILKLKIEERNDDVLSTLLIYLISFIKRDEPIPTEIKKKNGYHNLYTNIVDDLFIDFLDNFGDDQKKIIIETLYKIYIIN